VTFADLMAMKRVSDPQISPSGKWVMFSVTEVSLEKNTKVNHLWVVPMAGGKETQLTYSDSGISQTNGRFSPDGQWVMYTQPDAHGASQIFVAAWDDAHGTWVDGKAHPVTALETEADGGLWAPDSKHFLFTSAVYPGCEAKGPSRTEEQAKEEARCNAAKDAEAAASPVKAQVFDHLLYRHWNQFTGAKRSHIFYAALPAGLPAQQDPAPVTPLDLTPASAVGDAETPTFSLGGPLGYAWAPDSKEIAYVTNLDPVPAASTNNDVFTLRLDDPGAKAIKVSTSPGSDDGPQYSPDGKYLAFRSQARAGYESDRFRLMLFDREKKRIRELMPKFDRWVDEFAWSPSNARTMADALREHSFSGTFFGQYIYFISGNQGRAALYRVSLDDPRIERLSSRGDFSDAAIAPGGELAIATGMTIDAPAELYRIETRVVSVDNDGGWPDGTAKEANPSRGVFKEKGQLTHINDALVNKLDFGPMEDYAFSGANGAKVEGFIVRPPNFDASKKYPVKFLIHGGPQGAWGDSWSYRWNAELMAASGYVVVMVNPRGSTGYGQAFIDGINGDWGGKAYIDLMRGLDAAEAQFPFIDKTRECALGASYGGYMADWILTHTNRFKCIVTHDGMYDAESAYGSTEEMWFNEWEFRRSPATGAAAFDKEPAQPWRYSSLPADQDPFRKWSPMRYIQNAKTPTLVIHSQKDYRLDVSQGFELFTALQRRGVPSKFLYFPDESHWVLKPQNSQLWYQTVGDWCDRWTHTNQYAETH
jgi:dipeptidyl aminopeptidase/acylaminoacyl peptidase